MNEQSCVHKHKTRWIPNNGNTDSPMTIHIYNDEAKPVEVGGMLHALLLCKDCGKTFVDDSTATLRLVFDRKHAHA